MPKRKVVTILLGSVVGVAVLVIASCAGFLYMGYQDAKQQVGPRVDALFLALDEGVFPKTYETLASEELRDTVSRDEYAALGRAVDLRLGSLKSKSLQSFQSRKLLKGAYLDVSYKAEFEKGKGTILAKLKKEGGKWRFAGFRVNSPVFEQDLATAECPDCGEPYKSGAKFCPECGQQLNERADTEPATQPARSPESAAGPNSDGESSSPVR